jgi:hypothetical protein
MGVIDIKKLYPQKGSKAIIVYSERSKEWNLGQLASTVCGHISSICEQMVYWFVDVFSERCHHGHQFVVSSFVNGCEIHVVAETLSVN